MNPTLAEPIVNDRGQPVGSRPASSVQRSAPRVLRRLPRGTLDQVAADPVVRRAYAFEEDYVVALEAAGQPLTNFPRVFGGIFPYRWSYWSASMLMWLDVANVPKIQAISNCWQPGGLVTIRNGPDAFVPSWATIEYPEGVVVLFRGTSNYKQAILYTLGAQLATPVGLSGKVNSAFWASSGPIYDQLISSYGASGKPFYLTGHSYGAAAAVCTAFRLKGLGTGRNAGLVTFGCPRVGSDSFLQQIVTLTATVENVGDVVPALPPTAGILGSVARVLSLSLLSLEAYTRRRVGYGVGALGEIFQLEGSGVSTQDVIEFVTGLPSLTPWDWTDHGLVEYVRRFELCSALRGSYWARDFANGAGIKVINDT